MCKRRSFIVTRAGNVHDGLGLTDSHTDIREFAGLPTDDSTTYAFEWQPPKGWPDADFNAGLTQDTAPIPHWEMKAKHLGAIERYLRETYPDRAAWDVGDQPATADTLRRAGWRLLSDGESVSLSGGDRCYAVSGKIEITGQTGGNVWGYGNSQITSTGQTGGYVWGATPVAPKLTRGE